MAKTFLDATGVAYLFTKIKALVSGKADASHSHAAGDITSGTLSSDRLPTVPVAKGGTGSTDAATARTNLGITPANIGAAASSHNHAASAITSGTLGVARGGTGVTSNPSMLTNLGSTTAASVFATSPRPGVTGTLPIANGGTGATTAAAARTALGAVAENEDISIQKSGAAYESIFGQGTRNALLRVRNTAGDATNQRTIALFDSTQRPDIETAVRLYDVVDGTETIYSIFGEHNLDKLSASLGSAKIATGSYTGTGTYGSSNPCSLTFDFVPRMVVINTSEYNSGTACTATLVIVPQSQHAWAFGNFSSRVASNTISLSGNTLYWYNEAEKYGQLNIDGTTYNYTAIG